MRCFLLYEHKELHVSSDMGLFALGKMFLEVNLIPIEIPLSLVFLISEIFKGMFC